MVIKLRKQQPRLHQYQVTVVRQGLTSVERLLGVREPAHLKTPRTAEIFSNEDLVLLLAFTSKVFGNLLCLLQ